MMSSGDRLQAMMAEAIDKASRESLVVYRPSIYQLPVHRCQSPEMIIFGGKQAGKSVCAANEFASRVLGIPIMGPDGPIPLKYPVSTPEDPRTYWIIGLDVTHIGKTIYRLLFSPGMRGSLRVIRDLDSGQWRMFNPADPMDETRRDASTLAEPVIPARLIEHWAWESEAKHEFRSLTLSNGATIYAFPSSGRSPGMGDAVDGIWINEDIINPEFIAEWQDRLYTRDGWFMWDAAPQAKNNAIADMLDRAEACRDDPEPQISSFQIIASKNPFVSSKAKKHAMARMGTEEEIALRDRGEVQRTPYQMYDFNVAVHLVEKDEGQQVESPRTEAELLPYLYAKHGHLPAEWTRYLSIDPSHTRTGVLSGVVTPKEWMGVPLQHRLIVEWELTAKRKDADELAELLAEKMKFPYEAFIMDLCGARKTGVLEGRTTMQAAAAGFARHGLKSRTTGHDFMPGLAKPAIRQRYVRTMLNSIVDGMPLLLFLDQDIVETKNEFRSYRKKVNRTAMGGEVILDEAANPRVHDLMAGLEYLVGYVWPLMEAGQAFHVAEVQTPATELPPFLKAYLDEFKDKQQTVHLGPGLSAA